MRNHKYIKPSIQVIDIKVECHLLAGSQGPEEVRKQEVPIIDNPPTTVDDGTTELN